MLKVETKLTKIKIQRKVKIFNLNILVAAAVSRSQTKDNKQYEEELNFDTLVSGIKESTSGYNPNKEDARYTTSAEKR